LRRLASPVGQTPRSSKFITGNFIIAIAITIERSPR
jgi:hypothetical protein